MFYWLFGSALFLVFIFIKIYEFYKRSFIYNVKTGEYIPTTSNFVFLYNMFFDNLTLSKRIDKEAGNHPIYGYFFLDKLILCIRKPEINMKILQDTSTYQKKIIHFSGFAQKFLGLNNIVGTNGQEWKKCRVVMDPAFYDLTDYAKVFVEKSNVVLDKLDNRVIENFSEIMQQMTLDILGKCIFDHDFDSLSGKITNSIEGYNYIMKGITTLNHYLYSLAVENIPFHPYTKKVNGAIKEFDDLMLKLIEISKQRINEKKKSFSLLDFLVEGTMKENFEDKLTLQEVRDNVAVFFFAGHETTASALSFATLLLAKHKDVQEKARKEIDSVIGDSEPDMENVKNLDYLNMVIKEVLRLFPPIMSIPVKYAMKDSIIDDWFVPKGSLINVAILGIQHSKEIYGDPEKFRPERWSKEEQAKKKIPSSAWIPFSAGPRVCIGYKFSLLEQLIFLTKLLRKYKIEYLDTREIQEDSNRIVLQCPEKRKISFKSI